ncbi:hypothetical protein KY359_01085 [Candidatus Woesearchaeota archaeon]|nr:hypothetical protein [Candidatus Woesearchaeota archaeon]
MVITVLLRNMARKQRNDEQERLEELFRRHLKEQHNIDTEDWFEKGFIKEHLEGKHTLLPVSIFSNTELSALESIVKYLRENEGMQNTNVAALLGRTPAAVWITYRNASRKSAKRIMVQHTSTFIPTNVVAEKKFSVLESIALYLHQHYGLSYRVIAELLGRDQRTVWTVCNRARKKMAR